MSWRLSVFVNRHTERLVVGGSTYVTAIGGIVGLVATCLAFVFAFVEKSPAALACSLAAMFLSGVAVVYNCGRRILAVDSQERRRKDVVSAELGRLLERMEREIAAIRNTSVAEWSESGLNPAKIVSEAGHFVDDNIGAGESALLLSQVGIKWTPVPASILLPHLTEDAKTRQAWIDILTHQASYLKDLLVRKREN